MIKLFVFSVVYSTLFFSDPYPDPTFQKISNPYQVPDPYPTKLLS